MVYTAPQRYPANPTLSSQLGQGLAQGFQQAFQPAAQQQYQRGQLQSALGRLREQGQMQNASPTDILYNLIEASSYSPEIGRNLPQLYEKLNQAREAQALRNFQFGRENQFQNTPGQGAIEAQGEFRPRLQQESRSLAFPNNTPPQQAPGNLPQEATQGLIRPVLGGEELLQKAQSRRDQLAQLGVIKNFEDVYNQVASENEQNRVYNATVEQERERRISNQERYGEISEEYLRKLYPEATDEEAAIFRKKGEEAAGTSKSEADTKRFLAREAEKYKNTVSNIEKKLQAPRIQNFIQRSLKGTNVSPKQAETDAHAAIEPLLNEGLYDKARSLLSNAGFAPEEREQIVFGPLPKDINSVVKDIPKATKEPGGYGLGFHGAFNIPIPKRQEEYTSQSRGDLLESLSDIFEGGKNPNVNLLLLRKAYEDKGYDWRIFKDSLNAMLSSGQLQLTDDQQNQYNSYLNSPPLGPLDKILHGLNLIGR